MTTHKIHLMPHNFISPNGQSSGLHVQFTSDAASCKSDKPFQKPHNNNNNNTSSRMRRMPSRGASS